MLRRAGVLLAVVVCLLSGCRWDGSDGRDRNPDNQPRYARPSATRSSPPPHAVDQRHRVLGPAVRDEHASFQLVDGADAVRVRVADLGSTLFEISTPADAKAAPVVDVTDDAMPAARGTGRSGPAVVVGLRNTGRPGPAVVTAVLSHQVRWTVRLAGGAADEVIDLTGGPGGDVELAAGTSRAEVKLPAASGTQHVTMSGGAGELIVHLAGAGPARVTAANGAGAVTIDGQTRVGVPAGWVWMADGWSTAAGRYDIVAVAGVSALVVARSS